MKNTGLMTLPKQSLTRVSKSTSLNTFPNMEDLLILADGKVYSYCDSQKS